MTTEQSSVEVHKGPCNFIVIRIKGLGRIHMPRTWAELLLAKLNERLDQ